MVSIDEIAVFCKKKGFVFSSAEIYGGFSGFYDYGPLGIELKNNIKQSWWNRFVKQRDDIVGMEGTIVNHPKIWKASGHVDCFEDLLVEDKITKERYRADQLVESNLKISADGLSNDDIKKLIKKHKIKSPNNNPLSDPKQFNLMFNTNVGSVKTNDSTAYLRPETAQLIFTNFRQVVESARLKLPFGIAQIGKAFRNEISPRDFLFRVREFDQMEIEFFTQPNKEDDCLCFKDVENLTINILTAKDQKKKDVKHKKTKLKNLVKNKLLTKWHAYWLAEQYEWFIDLGLKVENIRIREHLKKELAHYATACFDIEYNFPFGWKEIYGNAARGNFDLKQHQEHSGKSMELFDEDSKKKFLPVVASEPSQGLGRVFLALLFDSYNDDKKRGNIVLKLDSKIVPLKVGVFPLLSNKPKLLALAQKVFKDLNKEFTSFFDKSGSIGRRYARADEVGVPICVTVDFDSLENKDVTIRYRDTTKQKRVKISKLVEELRVVLS